MVKADPYLEVRFYSTPISTKDFLWYNCLSISTNVWSLSRNLCNWIPSWFLKGKLEKHQKSEVLHKRTRKCSIIRKLTIVFSASINPEWLKTAMFCQLWLKYGFYFLSDKVHEIHLVYSNMIHVPLLAFNKSYIFTRIELLFIKGKNYNKRNTVLKHFLQFSIEK